MNDGDEILNLIDQLAKLNNLMKKPVDIDSLACLDEVEVGPPPYATKLLPA